VQGVLASRATAPVELPTLRGRRLAGHHVHHTKESTCQSIAASTPRRASSPCAGPGDVVTDAPEDGGFYTVVVNVTDGKRAADFYAVFYPTICGKLARHGIQAPSVLIAPDTTVKGCAFSLTFRIEVGGVRSL